MNTPLKLVNRLEELGAHLIFDGERVKVTCPESAKEAATSLLEGLRGQRQRLIPLVCDHGEYCRRLNRAKARITELPHYDGLVPWLKRDHSSLYCSFYVDTPRRIDRLWTAEAPIEEFQTVLDRWVEVHAQAIDLYQGRGAPQEKRK